MKYKQLTKEKILIAIDRLTRFKTPKDKYFRVFSDIITSSLIEPKIKKADLYNLDYEDISKIASEIINGSLSMINNNLYVNKILFDIENHSYKIDNDTKKLLSNTINYSAIVDDIQENFPLNLQFIKTLGKNLTVAPSILRNKYGLRFPAEKIVLVEGVTEEILLPIFAKFIGYDFDKNGIIVIAAGGKNQVVKKYYELIEELKLPIFVLLDKDAEENIKQITPKLRQKDKIHLVSCGEFEDLLPHSLIIKTVNLHFKNFLNINENDLNQSTSMAKILEELFKTRGLHEFKKAEFAKLVSVNINEITDISDEIQNIISEIFA